MQLYLAPMQGVVDPHLRALYAGVGGIGGVDVCVTEFVRITHTLLPAKYFLRLCPELQAPLPIPVRVQLLGSCPEMLAANAQRAAELGAPAIDLNFGCPAKTVNRHKGGACLLQEPETLFAIVQAVRQALPPQVPVTAKMRLGYGSRSGYVENAQALAQAGASEVIVHGRSKADGYHPPAYWDCIGEIQQALKIPVIANGEIWTLDDFLRCKAESGCQHFMLGRGLLAQPDLAFAIKAHQAGQTYSPLTWPHILQKVWHYHCTTLPHYDSRFIGNRLKQWLMYLQRQYPQAGVFFEAIKKLRGQGELEAAYRGHLEMIKADCEKI